jgi:hypothetical protein
MDLRFILTVVFVALLLAGVGVWFAWPERDAADLPDADVVEVRSEPFSTGRADALSSAVVTAASSSGRLDETERQALGTSVREYFLAVARPTPEAWAALRTRQNMTPSAYWTDPETAKFWSIATDPIRHSGLRLDDVRVEPFVPGQPPFTSARPDDATTTNIANYLAIRETSQGPGDVIGTDWAAEAVWVHIPAEFADGDGDGLSVGAISLLLAPGPGGTNWIVVGSALTNMSADRRSVPPPTS